MGLSTPLGKRLELRASFRSSTGAFTDPTEVVFRVEDPDGTVTVYTYSGATVTRIEAGKFRVYITPSISGDWFWRAEATGAVVDAIDGTFTVSASEVIDG